MMERIFLLEDDTTLSRGISMALCGTERTVVLADSIAQAQQKLTGTQFDLFWTSIFRMAVVLSFCERCEPKAIPHQPFCLPRTT